MLYQKAGFCLIDSLECTSCKSEYKMNISIENVKQLIQNQALEEHGKYINFHAVKKPQNDTPEYITDADLFWDKLWTSSTICDYTKDVVDLIIKITADALNINVMVCQENEGITELLKVTCEPFGKKVLALNSDRNYLYPQGNHYNPVILSHQKNLYDKKCENNIQNLQLLENEDTNDQQFHTPQKNKLEKR